MLPNVIKVFFAFGTYLNYLPHKTTTHIRRSNLFFSNAFHSGFNDDSQGCTCSAAASRKTRGLRTSPVCGSRLRDPFGK
jgi:hypothetical protein